MADRVERQELVERVARRTGRDSAVVGEIIDATIEEIYDALKVGEPVTLRGLGGFYVCEERSSWVFKFNPAQRLRAAFGWSSTYKGKP